MSEAKHTPGPWTITGISMGTGNISVGSKAQRIVIADVTNAASFGDMLSGAMRRGGGGFDQGDCHTQQANARLIAAAPDLLAFAEATANTYDDSWREGSQERRIGDAARAAIAKAKGR